MKTVEEYLRNIIVPVDYYSSEGKEGTYQMIIKENVIEVINKILDDAINCAGDIAKLSELKAQLKAQVSDTTK